MRAKLAATILAAVLAAGCASAPGASPVPSPSNPAASMPGAGSAPTAGRASPSASPAPSAAIAWKACADGAECGSLLVPLDPDRPDGDQIRLVLIRLPATDPAHRIGSIVVNFGGPGGPGTAGLRQMSPIFSDTLRSRFDIVSFDPRGVGLSDPVHCLDSRPPLPLAYPTEASGDGAFIAYAQAVAAACEANSGDLLPYVGTPNVVADLEAIRVALGEPKLTYLGLSYGTMLGALYADRYPTRIRAMVLDAPVDPALDLPAISALVARGYQERLDAFLGACAKDPACPLAADGEPRAAYAAAMARFADGEFDGVTQLMAMDAISGYLSADDTDGLAIALAEVADGEAGRLAAVGRLAQAPAGLDQGQAIACIDQPGPRTPEELADLAAETASIAPDFGAYYVYLWVVCTAWPVPVLRTPAPVRAPGAPPILVIVGTGDPATPPALGEALAEQLESAVLVTREGAGHANLWRSACIADLVDDYFVGLETPEPGTVCR